MIEKYRSSNSLIMCVTPLQMLIAEKIIELKSDENFDILTIALSDNSKYQSYFERVCQKCNSSLYYIAEPSLKGFIKYTKLLRLNKLDKEYKNLYLASIDSRHFQYLVSKNNRANIFTFDDGTANIIKESSYYLDSKPPIWKRIIWRTMGVKYYMDDIKSMSLTHYTIYKNIPNIIDNTFVIDLFDKEIEQNNIDKTLSIFLGQPLYEISKYYSYEFIATTIEKYNIDYYYPHPREKGLPQGKYEVIHSSLIFEDYILDFLKRNPTTQVHVYSFTSSALLNISQIERVKLNLIYDDYLEHHFSDFYSLARDKLNIQTVKLQDTN